MTYLKWLVLCLFDWLLLLTVPIAAPIAPQPPAKPIKSKGRGLGNTVKYAAIAGLAIGAGVAVYTLAF